MIQRTVIGIDPGSQVCGVSIIKDGVIVGAWNIGVEEMMEKITGYTCDPSCKVIIEDIRPYSMKLTMDIIKTCKVIGELYFRLKEWAGLDVELITRYEIKKWVFDAFPDVCIPMIEKKIEKKGYRVASTGEPMKPTFVFCDDKIVTECMQHLFKIKKPLPGKGYEYGLKEHSWQALAIAAHSYFSTA